MFHSWVYVHFDFGGGENATSLFVESTTGERRALSDERYTSINCLWNQVGQLLRNSQSQFTVYVQCSSIYL